MCVECVSVAAAPSPEPGRGGERLCWTSSTESHFMTCCLSIKMIDSEFLDVLGACHFNKFELVCSGCDPDFPGSGASRCFPVAGQLELLLQLHVEESYTAQACTNGGGGAQQCCDCCCSAWRCGAGLAAPVNSLSS